MSHTQSKMSERKKDSYTKQREEQRNRNRSVELALVDNLETENDYRVMKREQFSHSRY